MSGMNIIDSLNKLTDERGGIITDPKGDLLKKSKSAAVIIENILEEELNIIAEGKRKQITEKLVKRLQLDTVFYISSDTIMKNIKIETTSK